MEVAIINTSLDVDKGIDALKKVLSDNNRVIKKMLLAPHETIGDYMYIFYEKLEEQLVKEKEELNKLNKIAIELEKDEDYGKLKNSTQREIFILQKHSMPSGLAKKTIELVNMRKILQKETE
jgi:hypothetical protein